MSRAHPAHRAHRARRARLAGGIALAVLGPVVLAGCGGDDEDTRSDYCAEVTDQQQALAAAFAQGPTTGLIAALPSFEKLRDRSPDDIADDWAVVIRRTQVLDEALQDADVDPGTYDAEKPPAGVTKEQRTAIAAAASGLLTEATRASFGAVQQQARDVCGEPLSLQ